ncbi:trypsin-like peptidase domain-containing protein [Agromyces mediolanus]|uniref:S1C family serine protease n=1 Tax=Agromyces mediolanus TaxID=41986 RepID=UPI00204116E9|nr:trypsin-like peptidase domain-containing protein [Agromyces mediolanus]MCM3656231.1 trypsin-like peptidase domain-containing protein [Agromyces mediolanus]
MTDHTTGPVSEEPRDPEERDVTEAAGVTATNDVVETNAPEATAVPTAAAPTQAPASEAPTQAPASGEAPAAAPAGWVTPNATAPQQPAPATGTLYEPGRAPQPYHAAQYPHPAAQQPAPTATQPTQPLPGGHQAQHGQPQHGQPQPGQVPPGQVPPAFGGQPAAAPAPKKRPVGLGIAAAIVAAALIGGGAGAGVTALAMANRTTSTAASTSPQNVVVNDTDSVNQVTAVAAKASPSVVTISVSSTDGAGTGSGIVLSDDGYVLTNTHVVTLDGATGAPTIQVKTDDGHLYTAELIGTDPLSDLAVIKLKDASGLTPLAFADSSKLNVGDTAIAIGAPLGLSGTVTDGIVSALNRSIEVASSAAPSTPDDGSQGEQPKDGQQPFDFWNFDIPGQQGQGGEGGQQPQQGGGNISIPVIQTDAAINPGNSGGALLNSSGELIGVNVAILGTGDSSSGQSGNIGVGFAVPSNLAKRVSDEIIENGTATHGLLGATVTAAQSDESSSTVGALITDVPAGGAAANAGLKKGDIVTQFNGLPITDQTDLTAQVRALAGGADAEITFLRDGEAQTVTVTLGTFEG